MPRAMDDRLVAFAESAIRDYLVSRPESVDTLEGIHRWWIAWPEAEVSPTITRSSPDPRSNACSPPARSRP
jgi:hypothetical protein